MEKRIPSVIKDRVDLKHQTLIAFDAAVKVVKSGAIEGISIGEETNVLIMTNFGVVSGEIKMIGDKDETGDNDSVGQVFFRTLMKVAVENRNDFLAEREETIGLKDMRVINDSSFIVLENVTVTPFNNPQARIRFASLILFTDQIAGISFGQLNIG